MKLKILIYFIFISTSFNNILHAKESFNHNYFTNKKNIEKTVHIWNNFIRISAYQYNIDEKLVKSIIYVESSGNPYVKSKSNAIGLMQIKPSSAGLEVYRAHGKKGQPSVEELYNPKININIGSSYINLLQKKFLTGIKNKDIMRYATIVSYVNGAGALLKIFSKNKQQAISIINTMTVKSFCTYIKKNIQQDRQDII